MVEDSPESKQAGLLFPKKNGKTDLPYSKTFSPVTMEDCFQLSLKPAGLLSPQTNGKTDGFQSSKKPLDLLFPQKNKNKGPDYLKEVLDFVYKERHKIFKLKAPARATLEIGPLEDTIYSEEPKVVNGWGKFYLPEIVSMQVVGVVEGTSCPWDQLVLMTCEDGKLYAYDGEELHLVASNLKQLRQNGIRYPGSKRYYKGEAFKDKTEEDWEKVWNRPTGRRLDQNINKKVIGVEKIDLSLALNIVPKALQ